MKLRILGTLVVFANLVMGENAQPTDRFNLVGTSSVAGVQRKTANTVHLSAGVKKEIFGSKELLPLTLSIKNNTRTAVFLLETYPERDYSFQVRNERGETVSLTEAGEHLVNNTSTYRSIKLRIEPGQEVHHTVTINKLYDMTTPGVYAITIRRKVVTKKGKEPIEIKSDTISVTIIN